MTLAELKQKKVFVLGPVSGNPQAVTNAYRAAEERLQEYGILKRSSPFDDDDLVESFRNMDVIGWKQLVRSCIRELSTCKVLFLLPNSDTRFCNQILAAATKLRIPVITTSDFHKILDAASQKASRIS